MFWFRIFYSSTAESKFSGFDAVSLGENFPTFRRTIFPPYSRVGDPGSFFKYLKLVAYIRTEYFPVILQMQALFPCDTFARKWQTSARCRNTVQRHLDLSVLVSWYRNPYSFNGNTWSINLEKIIYFAKILTAIPNGCTTPPSQSSRLSCLWAQPSSLYCFVYCYSLCIYIYIYIYIYISVFPFLYKPTDHCHWVEI